MKKKAQPIPQPEGCEPFLAPLRWALLLNLLCQNHRLAEIAYCANIPLALP